MSCFIQYFTWRYFAVGPSSESFNVRWFSPLLPNSNFDFLIVISTRFTAEAKQRSESEFVHENSWFSLAMFLILEQEVKGKKLVAESALKLSRQCFCHQFLVRACLRGRFDLNKFSSAPAKQKKFGSLLSYSNI